MAGELGTQYNDTAYIDIHHEFTSSKNGEDLAGTLRFERFKPAHIDTSQWREILGADVDSLNHMPVMYGLTRAFLNECRRTEPKTEGITFTSEQEEVLLLAAITNNWGEVQTGNIAYDQKTTNLDQLEKDAYRQVLDELCGDQVDVKVRMLVERTVFDKHSKLGEVFDAIQRAGYLRTGLRAYHESKLTQDEELASHLRWLCANVFSNQIMMLVEYSKTYPPIKKFLTNQHGLISEAFESLTPDLFTQHGQNESIRAELFTQNKRRWYEFNQYEAQDLKNEIIATALRIATDKEQQQSLQDELESMLDLYAKVLSGQYNAQKTTSESFDRGLFGSSSNFSERYIPDHDELKRKISAIKELGLSVVLTSGSFDLLHIGHAAYVEQAKKYGDVLIVGVDSDKKMKRKGPDRPMIPEAERTQLLSHLRGVDIITIKPDDKVQWSLIKLVRPNTLITTQETYTEKEIASLHDYCDSVVVLPPQATTSTSAKIRRMNLGFGQKFLERTKDALDTLVLDETVESSELKRKIYSTLESVLDEVLSNE